ncbi:hypothetical protein CcCBS67573_g09708 [Chytriomyces confervae]|uniref:F-box/LRR-repeat protein 15-like leucin rich repeat domain-containing protein n=1 Tax=Chytriomyces confervae TaxID=246404 RepID=A0A507DP71_9FUNG|nr:hypothetical protein CcCBS67573_g09708 [Chytriomyces confervae]
MSQSSRRAWNRNANNTNNNSAGGERGRGISGPTSALSSFLRERGINTGRLNPYARLPDANANAGGNDADAGGDAGPSAEGVNADAQEPTQPQTHDGEDTASNSQAGVPPSTVNPNPLDLLTYEASTAAPKKTTSRKRKPEAEPSITVAEAAEVTDEPVPTTRKKQATTAAAAKKAAAAAKKKPKKNKDSDSENDNDRLGESTGRSGYSKRSGADRDSLVKFCQRCLRKFIPDAEGEDTCGACLTIPRGANKGAGGTGSKKIARKRSALVDDVAFGQIVSLKDMCIKLIADNIDSVEAFGDIPDDVKRSISRILSRRRIISPDTIKLFIGPEEKRVELFDCANAVILNLATHCQSIRSLTIKGAFLVTDNAFETLFRSPISKSLEDLFLENTSKLGMKGIQALAETCTTSLQSLSLSHCNVAGGEGVVQILGKMKGLKTLELIEMGSVSDDDLIGILKEVGNGLTKLSFNGFPNMTDKLLTEGICNYCPNLEHLSLRNNEQVTDEGMLAYLNTTTMSAAPLKSIDLNRLYNLTDSTITSLISHHGASLRRLILNGLDDLTEYALNAIVDGCPLVTELDLSWIRNFDDALFERMVGKCSLLKSVKVFGCNRLTEFSLVKRFSNAEGELIRVLGNEFD